MKIQKKIQNKVQDKDDLISLPKMSLGKFIKEAREDQKISIREMSVKTKIRKAQLIHLENDDIVELPSKAYVIGFVKSISDVLGIDQKVTLKLLDETLNEGIIAPGTSLETSKDHHRISIGTRIIAEGAPLFFKTKNNFLLKLTLAIMGGSIVGGTVIFSVYQSRPPVPQNNLVSHAEAVPPAVSLLSQKAKLVPKKIAVPAIELSVVNLSIKAVNGASWIAYKVDKEPIGKFTLKEGKSILLKGSNIRLLVGNYKALKILQNNKPVSITQNGPNPTAHLIFPEKLREQYKAPFFIFNRDGTAVTREQYEEKSKEI